MTKQEKRHFIYMAVRECEPHLVKIGYSSNPMRRMEELSGTGSVFPFHLLHTWEVERDAFLTERLIHDVLDYVRVNPNREFFDIFIAYSTIVDPNLPEVINGFIICNRLADDIDAFLEKKGINCQRISYNELADYYYSTHGKRID